jgi:transcriptional regulator with GAF, ATPase, and Fis domain
MSHAESLVRGETRPTTSKGFIAKDAVMLRLLELVERIAKSSIGVLIQGETGAGKEVIAGHLHRRSARAAKPFVALNCASLPANLLESELFGHEKGAFTGAVQAKPGLLETANGGTVLLDEIGETPLELQGKLLRALEQREVLRVGAVKARPIDVRFLAATNRDLEDEIVKKAFRQDLYFRINGVLIEVPPLRDRPGDIEALAEDFTEQACAREERTRLALAPETVARLKSYYWPGNVRELRNVIDRAVLLCTGTTITPEHLPLDKMASTRLVPGRSSPAAAPAPPAAGATPLSGPRAEEKQRIVDALATCAGNQTRAAELLGISRRTLVNKLLEFGINRPRGRE